MNKKTKTEHGRLQELGLSGITIPKTPPDSAGKRTTFSLDTRALAALEEEADQSMLSKREIIEMAIGTIPDIPSDQIRSSVKRVKEDFLSGVTERRTIALSSDSLNTITRRALEAKLHRDDLLSWVLLVWSLMTELSKQNRKESVPKALAILQDLAGHLGEVEKELGALLDDSDPIVQRFGFVVIINDNLVGAIEAELAGGDPVDPNEM
jgi:hypothetical protein